MSKAVKHFQLVEGNAAYYFNDAKGTIKVYHKDKFTAELAYLYATSYLYHYHCIFPDTDIRFQNNVELEEGFTVI